MFSDDMRTSRLFRRLTCYPRTTLGISLVLIVIAAGGLGRLVKDTSVKAFIPAEHPALIADEAVSSQFGVSDAIAVAVVDPSGSVFSESTLRLIADLTNRIAALPNIRAERVTSLATESSIAGTDASIDVAAYIDPANIDAGDTRRRWQAMPPHANTLVSDDERGAIILAPVIDVDRADETYLAVMQEIEATEAGELDIVVAGPGAVSGYLSRYIDEDARKLQPVVFLIVLGFIYFAFRRFAALPGPLLVVAGATGGALGLMAWNGVPYYAITNALPVIIVAISVADAIHVLSVYFQLRAREPDAAARDLVIEAMVAMARPITLTTITTIAGFAGIAIASIMPPVTAFALYAAAGVALAWLFSLVALPNMLVLLKLGASPAFASWSDDTPSPLGRLLAAIGAGAAERYRVTLIAFAGLCVVAAIGASELRVDRSQVENFVIDEPIRQADALINETFAGTAFIDVLIESDEDEGLLEPEHMQRIAALQEFMESLPHVSRTVSIADYLSVMDYALEARPLATDAPRRLPSAPDSIAQYLLLYEASGDPGDFDDEIDYGYQKALVRGVLDTHYYSETKPTIEALQQYVEREMSHPSLTATLAGDVTVAYHWMSRLEQTHVTSVIVSMLLVLVTSVLVFRSVVAGVIAVVPVSFAVLTIHAAMGFADIYLEPATSMFAAIAIGVGVDFGIHLVERLTRAETEGPVDSVARVRYVLPPAARACFFNSAALALGFSVLMLSSLPTLQRFGALVSIASLSSYVAALILVPALFAARQALRGLITGQSARWSVPVMLAGLAIAALSLAPGAVSARELSADEVARNVAERTEGVATRRDIEITLTNPRGRSRVREATILRLKDDVARYTRITYTAPKAIRATSFLSHDYRSADTGDSRWLYVPAARKVRRIPASERGDYFLGTDFSYEDIQSELKFGLDDYTFSDAQRIEDGDKVLYRVTGEPQSPAIAKELGYGRFEALVDAATWMPVQVQFFDPKLAPLKTVEVPEIREIDGIWTASTIVASNHRSGHQTTFRITNVRYPDALPDALFQASALARGLPASVGDVP